MNTRQSRWFVTIPFILLFPPLLMGQPVGPSVGVSAFSDLVNRSYGPDYRLANGIQYYDPYLQVKGMPYFSTNRFMDGAITLNDNLFKNVRIRYDLVSQRVEVDFSNLHGGSTWILPPADFVRGFVFEGIPFEKRSVLNGPGKFYQVIRTDHFTCYIHWHKKLLPLQNDQEYIHVISGIKTECYLEMGGTVTAFQNRASLVRIFPEEYRGMARRMMKKNGFRIKKASPPGFEYVLNSISEQINAGDTK